MQVAAWGKLAARDKKEAAELRHRAEKAASLKQRLDLLNRADAAEASSISIVKAISMGLISN